MVLVIFWLLFSLLSFSQRLICFLKIQVRVVMVNMMSVCFFGRLILFSLVSWFWISFCVFLNLFRWLGNIVWVKMKQVIISNKRVKGRVKENYLVKLIFVWYVCLIKLLNIIFGGVLMMVVVLLIFVVQVMFIIILMVKVEVLLFIVFFFWLEWSKLIIEILMGSIIMVVVVLLIYIFRKVVVSMKFKMILLVLVLVICMMFNVI